MTDRKYEDRLKDYVDVKARVAMFYDKHPDGRLVTDRVEIWQDDDVPRVVVKALAYRTVDDPHPGVGWSWMPLPGTTPYTRNSEVENAETSAWGRAIGSLGIGIGASIATLDEIAAKEGETERKHPGLVDGDPEPTDGSLIGTLVAGKPPTDLELRREPDGTYYTGFALTQGRKRLQVVAVGHLAEVLAPLLHGLVDQRVTVYGQVEMVPWKKDGRDMSAYPRVQLERIVTSEWTLPAVETGQEEGRDPAGTGEASEVLPRPEADSVPLFPEDPDA